jgi:hypothetical protein
MAACALVMAAMASAVEIARTERRFSMLHNLKACKEHEAANSHALPSE